MTASALKVLKQRLAEAKSIVAFTGAGISTECGVPDFRTPGSPWLENAPIDYASFLADPAMQNEAWRRKFAMDALYAEAKPGRGHEVLARLVRDNIMPGIITQNIDGLHQASGVPLEKLAQLHGNGTYAACLSCQKHFDLAPLREAFLACGRVPPCSCGGLLKSATISFGQPMPVATMQQALRWSQACDVFIAIGSSLRVHPAAQLPKLAKQAGACLVILNREATPLDAMADFILRDEIGTALKFLWPDTPIHPQILFQAPVARES